jgi:hypothetical protein
MPAATRFASYPAENPRGGRAARAALTLPVSIFE